MKKITLFIFLLIVSKGYSQTLDGTWLISPQAGALSVSPNQDQSGFWWQNSMADVTSRACFFDDQYVFNTNGTFSNVLGVQTWVENWQGGAGDACTTPIAPHNGPAATYTYNTTANTITINGVGAYLGIPKPYNGGELTTPSGAPASITYNVVSLTSTMLTLEISIGGGWWRFKFIKQGTPTCNDGIQNGDETGVDCGGTNCAACIVPPTVAAPTPPTRNAWDVKSLFSDAYTNITINDWAAGLGWGGYAPITDFMISGNATKRIDFGNFIGVDFGAGNAIDATVMTHFHMDFWIPATTDLTGKVLNPKLSQHATGVGEVSSLLLTYLPTVKGTWASIDEPLTAFAGSQDRNNIAQFLITSNLGITYVDNIYLYRPATASTQSFSASSISMYPNPSTNVLNIDAKSAIDSISIFNILGQVVINKTVENSSISLDVSTLNAGVYVITATIDGVVSTSKFVKK